MKYYIIAGEASGDLHASFLVMELKKINPNAQFVGFGGDLMQNEGVQIIKHYKDFLYMGFWEVIRNLNQILKNIKFCKKNILLENPDMIIFVDFPGFNLRIAKWSKKNNLKSTYYISPQVWAWKEKRVVDMKRYIDTLICILPFEKNYFKQKWNWDVEYVGHPLIEEIAFKEKKIFVNTNLQKNIIAFLPGSRKQEIKKLLPLFIKVAENFPDETFIVAGLKIHSLEFYNQYFHQVKNVKIIFDDSFGILSKAKLALVASGTATLETALMNVPQIVCFKTSQLSFFIAKLIIKIKYISLVNLIMDKLVVQELIQNNCNPTIITSQIKKLLSAEEVEKMKTDYLHLKKILSTTERASFRTAQIIHQKTNLLS